MAIFQKKGLRDDPLLLCERSCKSKILAKPEKPVQHFPEMSRWGENIGDFQHQRNLLPLLNSHLRCGTILLHAHF